jgi:hypothetical protein
MTPLGWGWALLARNARWTDADEHLHELGAGDEKERHLGLVGDRLGQQRL